MLPLPRVVAVRPNASIQEALDLSASSGVDRLPVITPEGQPVGLVNVLDILLEHNGESKPLSSYVRRIVATGEEEPAYRIAQQLRAARLGLAAVLDRKEKHSRDRDH